jgi:arginine decarboxylase
VLQPNLAAGFVAFDRTRLTVDVSGLGLTGFEVDERLHQNLGVTAELPGLQSIMFIVTLGNTLEDMDQLVYGFKTLADRAGNARQLPPILPAFPTSPHPPISPRAAFFAATETLPIEQTPDRISAELVCPYPPGIPVLFPGEVVTEGAIAYLQQIIAAGGIVTGCADSELKTLNVLEMFL